MRPMVHQAFQYTKNSPKHIHFTIDVICNSGSEQQRQQQQQHKKHENENDDNNSSNKNNDDDKTSEGDQSRPRHAPSLLSNISPHLLYRVSTEAAGVSRSVRELSCLQC
jgi:hypothetical protein